MLKNKAIIAGFLIGLGVIINTLSENPVIGATLFSLGLLTIIEMKLPLYTGQIGFIKEKNKKDLLNILIFNLIGILFCLFLYFAKDIKFLELLIEKSTLKFSHDYIHFLLGGFFCGTLIHFAVKCKKQIITIFAVVVFILTGAEHCIADFPYLIVNFNLLNLLKFLLVIIGNSLGAIFIEKMTKEEGI
jgi:formate/nitrite transporter FocA (FNT family)